jgi:hypothetical protein
MWLLRRGRNRRGWLCCHWGCRLCLGDRLCLRRPGRFGLWLRRGSRWRSRSGRLLRFGLGDSLGPGRRHVLLRGFGLDGLLLSWRTCLTGSLTGLLPGAAAEYENEGK